MTRAMWWMALAVMAAAVLASCAFATPEQQAGAMAAAQQLLAAGKIDQAQYDALVQVITGAGSWDSLGAWITGVASAALTALTGVRLMRGPAKPMPPEDAATLRRLVERERSTEGAPAAP